MSTVVGTDGLAVDVAHRRPVRVRELGRDMEGVAEGDYSAPSAREATHRGDAR